MCLRLLEINAFENKQVRSFKNSRVNIKKKQFSSKKIQLHTYLFLRHNLLHFSNHLQHNMISSCLTLTIFLYGAALQRVAAL